MHVFVYDLDVIHQVYTRVLYHWECGSIWQTKLVYLTTSAWNLHIRLAISNKIKDDNTTVTLFTISHILRHYFTLTRSRFSNARFRLFLLLPSTTHNFILACKPNWLCQLQNFTNSKWGGLPAALQTNPIS